jgi:hypothetical protein
MAKFVLLELPGAHGDVAHVNVDRITYMRPVESSQPGRTTLHFNHKQTLVVEVDAQRILDLANN